MKVYTLKEHDEWMIRAIRELNLTELRVFVAWFMDHKTFSAGPTMISDRAKGKRKLSMRNASKALKSLAGKGFLVRDGLRIDGEGYLYRLPIYEREVIPLDNIDSLLGVSPEKTGLSPEITRLSTENTRLSVQNTEVIPTEAQPINNQLKPAKLPQEKNQDGLDRWHHTLTEMAETPGITRWEYDFLVSKTKSKKPIWFTESKNDLTKEQRKAFDKIEKKVRALKMSTPPPPEELAEEHPEEAETEGDHITFTAEEAKRLNEKDEQHRLDTIKAIMGEEWFEEQRQAGMI